MHTWLKHYDLILFDFDGLLVDTEPLHFKAYQFALKDRGFDLPWDLRRYLQSAMQSKHALSEDIYSLFPKLHKEAPDWTTIRDEKQKYYHTFIVNQPPTLMPGAETLLSQIQTRGIKHGIVTNSKRKQLELIANSIPKLHCIPIWVTRDDYERPKPSPDSYLKGIELLGEKGDRILAFEDSVKGVAAISSTEITPILICPEDHPQFRLVDSIPCSRYDSFSFLEELDILS